MLTRGRRCGRDVAIDGVNPSTGARGEPRNSAARESGRCFGGGSAGGVHPVHRARCGSSKAAWLAHRPGAGVRGQGRPRGARISLGRRGCSGRGRRSGGCPRCGDCRRCRGWLRRQPLRDVLGHAKPHRGRWGGDAGPRNRRYRLRRRHHRYLGGAGSRGRTGALHLWGGAICGRPGDRWLGGLRGTTRSDCALTGDRGRSGLNQRPQSRDAVLEGALLAPSRLGRGGRAGDRACDG